MLTPWCLLKGWSFRAAAQLGAIKDKDLISVYNDLCLQKKKSSLKMITRLHQVNFKNLTTGIKAYKNRYCLTRHNKRSRYVRYVSARWILINSALPAAPASSAASRQLHDTLGLRVAAAGWWESGETVGTRPRS